MKTFFLPPGYRIEVVAAEPLVSDPIVMDQDPDGRLYVIEMPAFANGTTKIAKAVAKNNEAISIIGGGDSVAAVKQAGVADQITHISTGGGASLEFLEGKKLPGVEALTNK